MRLAPLAIAVISLTLVGCTSSQSESSATPAPESCAAYANLTSGAKTAKIEQDAAALPVSEDTAYSAEELSRLVGRNCSGKGDSPYADALASAVETYQASLENASSFDSTPVELTGTTFYIDQEVTIAQGYTFNLKLDLDLGDAAEDFSKTPPGETTAVFAGEGLGGSIENTTDGRELAIAGYTFTLHLVYPAGGLICTSDLAVVDMPNGSCAIAVAAVQFDKATLLDGTAQNAKRGGYLDEFSDANPTGSRIWGIPEGQYGQFASELTKSIGMIATTNAINSEIVEICTVGASDGAVNSVVAGTVTVCG